MKNVPACLCGCAHVHVAVGVRVYLIRNVWIYTSSVELHVIVRRLIRGRVRLLTLGGQFNSAPAFHLYSGVKSCFEALRSSF